MSLTLFLCEVEESEKGWPIWASLQKSSFALNFRQVHGAQVALLQSPILRLLHDHFNSSAQDAQKRRGIDPQQKTKRPINDFKKPVLPTSPMKPEKQTRKVLPSKKNVLPMS